MKWYNKLFFEKLKPSSFLLSFFCVPHDCVAEASVEIGQQIFHFHILKVYSPNFPTHNNKHKLKEKINEIFCFNASLFKVSKIGDNFLIDKRQLC